jgi:hypothetical protein
MLTTAEARGSRSASSMYVWGSDIYGECGMGGDREEAGRGEGEEAGRGDREEAGGGEVEEALGSHSHVRDVSNSMNNSMNKSTDNSMNNGVNYGMNNSVASTTGSSMRMPSSLKNRTKRCKMSKLSYYSAPQLNAEVSAVMIEGLACGSSHSLLLTTRCSVHLLY